MALVSIIVAVSANNVIGANDGMPWSLPSDLKRFRSLTMGKPIIMGRKTHESIGRPLDGRVNIVVTRQKTYSRADIIVCASFEAAMEQGHQAAKRGGVDEICVIGGGEIYRAALDEVDRIYMTRVHGEIEGDTFFPALDPKTWMETSCEPCGKDDRDSIDTSFHVFERR